MHDIKKIRNNPEEFDRQMARRGLAPISKKILIADGIECFIKDMEQTSQSEINALSKEVGVQKSKGNDVTKLLQNLKILKEEQKESNDVGNTIKKNDDIILQLQVLDLVMKNILFQTLGDECNDDNFLEYLDKMNDSPLSERHVIMELLNSRHKFGSLILELMETNNDLLEK